MLTGFLIFVVAVLMTMVGKGGGNFYVVILAASKVPMHEAATTGQFILFSASMAAMAGFHQKKAISWRLAMIIGLSTATAALAGGFFSHLFSSLMLKSTFAGMLLITGAIMLLPVANHSSNTAKNSPGIIAIRSGTEVYAVNLWLVLPVAILAGFGSGMVGVSGGSFLVPLMVLACGVPMRTAVATATTLIAGTALMGFIGHALQGDFNPSAALPLAVVTILGGAIGSKFALQARPVHLKKLFAYSNWAAAAFMIFDSMRTAGVL